jgi:hypothetical protein
MKIERPNFFSGIPPKKVKKAPESGEANLDDKKRGTVFEEFLSRAEDELKEKEKKEKKKEGHIDTHI